jgi:hypothetical protein
MSRFRGPIGINRGARESAPGIFTNVIEEVMVQGEMRNVSARWSQQNANETLTAKHVLSVVTPEKSEIDFNAVVYIVWQGSKWSVTSIQYNRPRVELTLGGLYNG